MSSSYEPVPPSTLPAQVNSLFTIGLTFSEAWSAFKKNYVVLLGAVVLALLIWLGIAVVASLLGHNSPALRVLVDWVLNIFIAPPFLAGVLFMGVRAFRGDSLSISNMFEGFSRYWAMVGIYVLTMLLAWACALPGLVVLIIGLGLTAVGGLTPIGVVLAILGVLAMLAGAIIVYLRLAFAPVACLDPANGKAGVVESLALSWKATGPVAWRLLGLYLVTVLLMIATLLLLIVGIVFIGYPLGVAIYGTAYCLIFAPRHIGPSTSEPPMPPQDWQPAPSPMM